MEQKVEWKKYRIDIRMSKTGKIVESFWTNSFDIISRPNSYINIYQRFRSRLFKVCHYTPEDIQKSINWRIRLNTTLTIK